MSILDSLILDPAPFTVFLADRADGITGSGTHSDPYDGSSQEKFDGIMRTLGPNTRIQLGSGTFETKGYYEGAPSEYGWRLQSGMKIIGSGRGVTKVSLVGVSASVSDPRKRVRADF